MRGRVVVWCGCKELRWGRWMGLNTWDQLSKVTESVVRSEEESAGRMEWVEKSFRSDL